ncbi:MAG TPA: substrate-binding domain-containing protein [Terriglobales bacterium]|jgi:ribose transport system substrate-binding protein|nr:substrate-binding domain-containing protein [Terriglobales bacterium]
MDKLNVVLCLITDENDYQRHQAAEAEATARRLGLNLRIFYAGNDAVEQSQQLLKVIQDGNRHTDAILVEPVGTGMPQVAAAAIRTGISWVVMNRDVTYLPDLRKNSAAFAFSVSTNNEEVGKLQGRQFGALLRGGGSVLYLEGPTTSTAARMRSLGMKSTKPDRVDVKTLKGDWTKESGHRAITSWLRLSTSRQLHVGLVSAQNDAMAMGARAAFQELVNAEDRQSWLAMPFTGCDGLPDTGKAWVNQKLLAATVVAPALTPTALELVVKATQTKTQPPECTLITPSSYPSLEELSR